MRYHIATAIVALVSGCGSINGAICDKVYDECGMAMYWHISASGIKVEQDQAACMRRYDAQPDTVEAYAYERIAECTDGAVCRANVLTACFSEVADIVVAAPGIGPINP